MHGAIGQRALIGLRFCQRKKHFSEQSLGLAVGPQLETISKKMYICLLKEQSEGTPFAQCLSKMIAIAVHVSSDQDVKTGPQFFSVPQGEMRKKGIV